MNRPISWALIGIVIVILAIVLFDVRNTSSAKESTIGVREIKIVANQFSFSPNLIKLKLNEDVRFKLISSDVPHGFTISELGINQYAQPGKETVFDFKATKKGTFNVICSVSCGSGHGAMRSTLIIE